MLVNRQFETFSAWMSYSFSVNDYQFENLNDGNKFPNNVDVRHAVTLAGTYSLKSFKMALALNYRSGIPSTKPLQNQSTGSAFIVYDVPNDDRVYDYLSTDFSATYQFRMGKITKATVGASIWNLFDRINILNTYYRLDDDNSLLKIENKSLGVTLNFNFRMWF